MTTLASAPEANLGRIAPRELVLDNPVDAVSRADAVDFVVDRAFSDENGAYVCLTNVHSTIESRRVKDLRTAVEGATLSVPDGQPLVWILRHRGHSETQKTTGIEFIPRVAAKGKSGGLRHLFYGGAPGVARAAAEGLKTRVPGIEVVGALTAPFSQSGEWPLDDLKRAIQDTRPHIIWVGLGAPKQEIWMSRVAPTLDVPVMVGVGAAFDFLAGRKRPAPRFLSDIGLEWLFRLLSEPRRLARRYVIGNSEFVWLVSKGVFTQRDGKRKSDA